VTATRAQQPKGIDISRAFFQEEVLPAIQKGFPHLAERMSCGVFGSGSDATGLDDEISRDHHWGPRTNILLPSPDNSADGRNLKEYLDRSLPKSYQGFPLPRVAQTASGISVESIDEFFRKFTGSAQPPEKLTDWFLATEADLFHATNGEVFYDPTGELKRRREGFRYYPELVWKKKNADWCMYFTGRDAPYNIHRCARRKDWLSAEMFLGAAIKRALELAFLLNKTYAPYSKWLYRKFLGLPRLVPQVDLQLQRILKTDSWRDRVMSLVEIAHIYAEEIHHLGLAGPPKFKPFDESLTDLILYESALEIYKQVPTEWLHLKFNEVEYWEVMAREVLFDSSDYFQRRLRS
jgi:hypothetical protein